MFSSVILTLLPIIFYIFITMEDKDEDDVIPKRERKKRSKSSDIDFLVQDNKDFEI